MKTIYIHLSGIPGERITPKESDEYYSASRKYLEVNKNVKLIPWDVQNQRYRDIRAAASKSVERYYERMGETWNRKEQLFIGNFLNDYVSYSLAPFASLLSAVNEIISDNSSNRVIILYRKSRESQPPLFGIPTKENPRGVPELLESRVGAYLKGSGLPANVEFIEIGLGLTFADVLRRAAFQILGGLFAIRNLLRLFNFERKVQSNRDKVKAISDSPLLTIVRNERQADYFEILVNEGLEAKALYLPQLMLRSQHIKTEMLSFYDHGGSVATTIWNSTLFLCRWFVNRAITYLRHYRGPEEILIEGICDAFKLKGEYLYKECRVCDAFYFEAIALERQLKSNDKTDMLLSFEMEGTRAAFINSTARRQGLVSATIQTAEIASLAQPLFPMSDLFFVRSKRDLAIIPEDKGVRKLGEVVYEGDVYDVLPLYIPDAFTRLLFISQPKGHQALESVLISLGDWARENDAKVGVRLHPRDLSSSFENVLSVYPDTVSIRDRGEKLEDALAWSNLVVVYSSSVGMEALALGKMVVSCIWDSRELCERRIGNGYVCAGSEEILMDHLSEPGELKEKIEIGRKRIFGAKSRKELVSYINSKSKTSGSPNQRAILS